jgi:UDP-N-acetylmuramate dehydrogenase
VVAGIRGEVRFRAPLRDYTSYKIGGPADVLVKPADVDDLARLVRQARGGGAPLFVLGGTNLLVRDGGIRGIVVNLSHLDAVTDVPGIGLYAEAGIGMPALMQQAARRGLGGLEWAAGIPGTLGGCVAMNAGTRLGEMSAAVQSVRVVTPAGRIKDYPRSALAFSYRRTRLPPGIVAGVWLRLSRAPPGEITAAVKTYLRYRKATQPLTEPNAGCVFKNPSGQSAGALIERAGLKGSRIGDAQVSERHANFIVNRGSARSADAIALIRKVRRIVKARCGVTLELEQKIVGDA